MDSLIFELQIVFYFQLFLSANVRHSSPIWASEREAARGRGKVFPRPPAFASLLARPRFTHDPPNGELARRLSVPLHRARKFEKEKKLRSNEPHLFSFNFSNSQNKEFRLNFSH